MSPRADEGVRCLFFAPEASNPGVVRHCSSLARAGVEVKVYAFARKRFQFAIEPTWSTSILGRSSNRRYLPRLWKLALAFLRLAPRRGASTNIAFFVARNVDMALLAMLLRWFWRSRAPLAYEVLDVPPAMVRSGAVGRVLRWAERRILSQASLVVVSSPAFVSSYFKGLQGYEGDWHLLENMLSTEQANWYGRPSLAQRAGRHESRTTCSWVVGWFGTLRDRWSIHAIGALASRTEGLRFYIRGYSFGLGETPMETLRTYGPTVDYGGKYDATRDLGDMYDHVDLMWCLDLVPDGSNNEWLLPNRLYEAAYFGVPLLAVKGTATGNLVEQLGIGWTLPARDVAAIDRLIRSLSEEAYLEVVKRILLYRAERFSGSAQTAELVRRLRPSMSIRPQPSP